MAKSKNLLTYGTFDLFHVGHVRLLKSIKQMGDRLYVGLSTDSFNRLKGKKTIIGYDHRREILLENKSVDVVFPEEDWEQKINDVKRLNIDLFVMGDDWKGKFDFLSSYCDVLYLPRTPDISSTDIKLSLEAFSAERLTAMRSALDSIDSIVKSIR